MENYYYINKKNLQIETTTNDSNIDKLQNDFKILKKNYTKYTKYTKSSLSFSRSKSMAFCNFIWTFFFLLLVLLCIFMVILVVVY